MVRHGKGYSSVVTAAAALLALVLAACAPAAPPSPTAAPAKPAATSAPPAKPAEKAPASAEFARLVQAARQEGEVVYWGIPPALETLNQKLLPAFNQRFGTNIKVTRVPVEAREAPTRLLAESKQPLATVDVVWGLLAAPLTLHQAGVLPKFPWAETFGGELPAIKDRVERIMEPVRGGALESDHNAVGIVFNVTMAKREELPKKWEDLGDPKWAGKIATDPNGSGYSGLWMALGEEKMLEIVRKVKANKPIFTRTSADTAQRVAAGQAMFGVASATSSESQKLAGAPIDWYFLDPVPVDQTVYYLPQNPPHPNAGRLYAAWVATDGMKIMDEVEGRAQTWPGTGFKMARVVEASNVKVLVAKSLDELVKIEDARKKITQIFSE